MEITKRRLADIVPYAANAKKHDKRQINNVAESIKQYGFVQPIVIDRDGVIVIGHCRALAAKKLGMEEVPCVCVDDLTPEQVNALRLVDNKSNESDWDFDLLADELPGLDLSAFDFEWGLRDELNDSVVEDDYEPVIPAEPKSNLGDVYQLGDHRLMCGDSTSQDDMAVLMNGEIADLVVTDPPYNVNYGDKAEMLDEYLPAKGHRNINHIKNDNMDNQSFYSFLLATYQSAYEFMRAGAAIYVFHAESTGHIFRQAFLDAGLKLAQCLIWEKNAFVLGRQDYQWRHEPCLYGWKEGAAHYFINDRTQDTVILEDDIDFSAMKKNELVAYLEELRRKNRDQTSVIYENKPTRNDIHPTMKPIALVGKFITNSSKSGWNVLDLFGGSGSTLMAAEQLGRTAFIMELDERFCDVIVKRWEDYTGQQAVRIPAEDVK